MEVRVNEKENVACDRPCGFRVQIRADSQMARREPALIPAVSRS